MKPTDYVVFIAWSDEDQSYLATVPDLPGCMADGESDLAALANVRLAINDWIEVARGMGRDVPVPRDFRKLETDAMTEHQEFERELQDYIQRSVHSAIQSAVNQNLPEIMRSIAQGANSGTVFYQGSGIGSTLAGLGFARGTPFAQRHLPLPDESAQVR